MTLTGADAVVSALGFWPSFHDAEILAVHIVRGGVSTVTLVIKDARAPDTVIAFVFQEIACLELGGENPDVQNVVFDLRASTDGELTTVTFDPCYGLSGYITAKHVSVRIEPRAKTRP